MKRISRGKKKRLLIIAVSIAVVVAGVAAAFIIGLNQIKSKYELDKEHMQQEMEANKRTVYVANGPIPAGTQITNSNTTPQIIYSSQSQDFYMTASDLDMKKVAAVDILDGQSIFSSMLGSELEFGVREVEYGLIKLSTNLSVNDFVDVRIMYPNGENYIVLSKKDIKQLDLSINDVFLWLDEEEIMLMSSAIVDTYIHAGSILYTTKYIEDSQETTAPTYTPTTDCMIAMGNDKNIVNIATDSLNASLRSSLDGRLQEYESNNNVNLLDSLPSYQGNTSDSSTNTTDGKDGVLSGVDTGEGTQEDNGSSDESEYSEDEYSENEASMTYEYEEDTDNGY